MKRYAIALLGATIFAGAAWSQVTAPASSLQFLTVKQNDVLSSNVVGADLYSHNNEEIGKVADIVLDNGSVAGYILSVGGFLGVGERYVAVQPASLSIAYDASAKKWKASANATKDQLKNAPEFKYDNKWRS
jgi:hypothetical protein